MQTIAGYRLVRVLARGTHAEVWLGATDASAPQVAIKLFHSAAPVTRIDTEVEALGRADHRHVQRLLDISLDPSGRTCLVLERLGPSLGRVLADRGSLSAGEAVTALAPVCEAVSELHRVGVAHGRIDAAAILFDSSGAPVLTRFGGATLVGEFPHESRRSLTPAQESASGDLAHDREALATLTERVLDRVEGESSVRAWLATHPASSSSFPSELAERLHASSPAAAVVIPGGTALRAGSEARQSGQLTLAMRSWVAPTSVNDGSVPTRHLTECVPAPSAGWLNTTTMGSLLPPWLVAKLTAWLHRMRSEWLGEHGQTDDTGPVRQGFERMRVALRAVRPRVWAIAAGGLLAALATIALAGADSPPPAETHAPASSTSVEPPVEPPSEHAVRLDDETSHDPLVAARALLLKRERCFTDLSVLCLAAADQSDSAAMESDAHAIRQHQQGAAQLDRVDWSQAELSLIDDLGDGVMIAASLQPSTVDGDSGERTATILLVRTENGWRIRDLIG